MDTGLNVKFKIENTLLIKDKAYVLAKLLDTDRDFFLTDASYLNEVAIENWMDIPRAHDMNGNIRLDLFVFALKNLAEKDEFKIGQIVTLKHF